MTTIPHDGRCRCDSCALTPSVEPLNKRQRQIQVDYEGKLAVAAAAQTKARGAYDQATKARFADISNKMRDTPANKTHSATVVDYEPTLGAADAETVEQYDLARAELERATARVTTLILQRDEAIRQAGLTLAAAEVK